MVTLSFKPFADNARIRLAADDRRSPIAAGEPNRDAVRILQNALLQAGIPLRDGADGIFGPLTAGAVRAAELKFGLSVDSGRAGPQVIGALDRVLGAGGGQGPGTDRFPSVLNLILQRTPEANTNTLDGYFQKAVNLLDAYGMKISLTQSRNPPIAFIDPYNPVVDVPEIRKASEQQTVGRAQLLRVIAAKYTDGFRDTGDTTLDGAEMNAAPFITLNTIRIATDNATLIHEMIHATGLHAHDPDPDSVFFATSSPSRPRTILKPEHAKRISQAFFATRAE